MLWVKLFLLIVQCRLAYMQEANLPGTDNAPLFVYVPLTDLQTAVGAGTERVDVVKNGQVELDIFTTPQSSIALPIPRSTAVVPIVFLLCIENVTVTYSWTSLDASVVGDPIMSIPSGFVFPTCSYRVLVAFPCIDISRERTIPTRFVINASTANTTYAPIEWYLSKVCDRSSEQISFTEFPAEFSSPFGMGCFNDTDPPTKSVPIRTMKKTSTDADVIVVAVVVPISILMIVILVVVSLLVWYFWQHKKKKFEFTIEMMAMQYQAGNPLFDRVATLHHSGPHQKEFASENLTFVRELGEGAFGRVYQGTATNIIVGEDSTIVAVKQLKMNPTEDDDKIITEFFKEVTFMSKLDHPRIVKLLGVCTLTEPYCMIFEYMDFGDLNAYLRSAIGLGPDCDEAEDKGTCFLQLSDLLSILEQIAEGMEYLSNQSLVHRDLATRNCLVATGLVVKISDFGLSRDVNSTDYYRVHGRAVLPIRWMAPESIIYGKFTVATDVWSFGVVMWEVFTYGQQPYVGLTNEEVINFVTKQGTLESPSGCPEKVTKLMAQCWSQSPASRPKFSKVLTAIQHLTSTLKDVMYDSPDYPALALQVTLTDAD